MTNLTLPTTARTGTLPSPGLHSDVPDAVYRSWPAISQSDLKAYLDYSAAACKLNFDGQFRKESSGFSVGLMVHTMLLEPDRYREEVVITDERRTKAFLEKHQHKIVAKQADGDAAQATADAISQQPLPDGGTFQDIIDRGQKELSMFWYDRETGLPCKGRIDLYDPVDKIIYDLKTTGKPAAPGEFAKACANYGYDIQSRFYKRGIAEAGGKAYRFVFVAAETEPPHQVGMYHFGGETERVGAARIRTAMQGIAKCVKSGRWPGYNSTAGVPDEIELPGWALRS